MSVARTIAHELLHAYLIIANSNPASYGYAFGTVQSYLSAGMNPLQQHTLMAEKYRSALENVLNNFIIAADISVPTGPPYENLSLEDYVSKLAWGGLYKTAEYEALPANEKAAIVKVISAEEKRTASASNKKGC